MEYLSFIFISILSTILVSVFLARFGVFDTGKKINIYKPCVEEITPYRGIHLILTIIIFFVISLAIQISLYKNTSPINMVKLYGLYLIVFCAGVVDSKRKIIPNILIILGLFFRCCIYGYEIISKADIIAIVKNDLIGFAMGFGFLSLVCILSRGSLGFGDAKLFGVIGLISGSYCTYSTLLLSLIISVVFSIVNIARKKMGRKDSFPFGPCIMVGYIIVVLLTSY